MLERELTKFSLDDIADIQLSDMEKIFAMEYIRNGFIGSTAVEMAGFKTTRSSWKACVLLKKPEIKKYINILKKDLSFCIGISAVDIAKEYAKIGFANIKGIFEEDGTIKNINDISIDDAANIASIEIQGRNTRKIKFHDKIGALDKLAKMIGADGITRIADVDSNGQDVVKQVMIIGGKTIEF